MVRRICACICTISVLLLSLSTATPARAQSEDLDVQFDFVPAKEFYVPGENFTIEFMVTNSVPNSTDYPVIVKVESIQIQFTWMGLNEWLTKNVSSESRWLNSSEYQTFSAALQVPANATLKTYSYLFKVWYSKLILNTPFGIQYPPPWEPVAPYHDFVVSQETQAPTGQGRIDYLLFVSAAALVLAVGAIGAFLYHTRSRRQRRPSPATDAATLGVAEVPPAGEVYPVIHALPGEQFPIEKGFIYLVKEKRPSIAFAMFNEATGKGAKGMLVAREHPNRLKQMHEFDAAKILWLTRRAGVNHIDPTELSLLSLEITKFVEGVPKSVVLLEGLEYVITQNDFESVLRFVNHLHDFVLAHDCAVIVVIDPRVLSTRELALLERSARIVEPAERAEEKPPRIAQELDA